jgi:hypothetical protein
MVKNNMTNAEHLENKINKILSDNDRTRNVLLLSLLTESVFDCMTDDIQNEGNLKVHPKDYAKLLYREKYGKFLSKEYQNG